MLTALLYSTINTLSYPDPSLVRFYRRMRRSLLLNLILSRSFSKTSTLFIYAALFYLSTTRPQHNTIMAPIPTYLKTIVHVAVLTLFHGYDYTEAGIPSNPLYYEDQLVDHLSTVPAQTRKCRVPTVKISHWTQRYYASDKYFNGPGSPIFLIMGGEGAIKPSTGLYYPFVVDHLAKDFGAHVVQPEHRFYGESQPLGKDFDFTGPNGNVSNITTALMTSEQAMWDAVRLVRAVQEELGCSTNRISKLYCPVITVGGSYPGFLSAMMRVRHPTVIDMAYASSAPMGFYSQEVNQFDYYDHITQVAEQSSNGCKNAVRSTLVDGVGPLFENINTEEDLNEVASLLGICKNTIPRYISDADTTMVGNSFYEELMMVVAYTFANYNMANYPPDENTSLYHACQIFQNDTLRANERLARFLAGIYDNGHEHICFNMIAQLPSGSNATISSGDWSGVGTSHDGEMWDFQTCTLLVEQIGFGEQSMFPKRRWALEWMNKHCQNRFGVVPTPYKLVNDWKFDDLESAATKIIFTNGMNDGWSVGGITHNLSDSLLALNFENGAHHSELSGIGPSERDTPDIKRGFKQIKSILREWLAEDALKSNAKNSQLSNKVLSEDS